MADTSLGPLLFIGAGNMGGAIARGVVASGLVDPADVAGVSRSGEPREGFSEMFVDPGRAMDWLGSREQTPEEGAIVLAVKPQMLAGVEGAWAGLLSPPRLVISVLAGTTSSRVREAMGGSVRVVRSMPNTPSQIGLGCSAIAAGTGATDTDMACAERLFGSVGQVVRLDEELIDAFTAVAGSGPAYVFYLAEAMTRGAAQVGLPEEAIAGIVSQTIRGAAELLARSDESPGELSSRVSSKGGTTHAATSTFDRHGVTEGIARGIVAARDRGRELASET